MFIIDIVNIEMFGLGIKIVIQNYIYVFEGSIGGGLGGVNVYIEIVVSGLRVYVGLIYLIEVFGVLISVSVMCEGFGGIIFVFGDEIVCEDIDFF